LLLKIAGYSSAVIKREGLLRRRKRIVGGDAVELGAYPWMVSFLYPKTYAYAQS